MVMQSRKLHIIIIVMILILTASSASAQILANYLYGLSNFEGQVQSLWARVTVDRKAGEVYTLDRSESVIQIFNQTAMETFSFGENMRLSSSLDIAAGHDGDTFILYRHPAGEIAHLNYRGELVETLSLSLNTSGEPFKPDFIDFNNNRLFLADSSSMKVVIATVAGEVVETINFKTLIGQQIKQASKNKDLNRAQIKKINDDLKTLKSAGFGGFSVDINDNIYFTLASFFTAYRYSSSSETLKAFGVPGSAPGAFGVVAGICADRHGNIYVADRLRSVVLVFDSALEFLSEFGYRGMQAHNLVVPDDIAIDEKQQRVYVSQAANRGVSVFGLSGL